MKKYLMIFLLCTYPVFLVSMEPLKGLNLVSVSAVSNRKSAERVSDKFPVSLSKSTEIPIVVKPRKQTSPDFSPCTYLGTFTNLGELSPQSYSPYESRR